MMTTMSTYSSNYKGETRKTRAVKRTWQARRTERLLMRLAVATLFFVLLFTGLSLMTSQANSEYPAAPTASEQIVVVGSGDTLWNIASSIRKEGEDIRHVVFNLKQRNNLTSSSLQAGQSLIIPAE
ncbi:LysM peptidoglycan-binding domain-containing protein [Paenibacillus sp. BC26]|uniref:LysM peptidoglycan-binding domain-containing protein n=1 Tax=Paenibacillus sp. BC26 TaxID=1881032 RepID=UPI000B82F698|nr:LysM peptidoglycan-binding domain-containing protein [Paenibacillus sp. BC26]